MVVAFLVGLLLSWPPLAEVQEGDGFSTDRAMTSIRRWSREPRPSGSVAHSAVVDDLARNLAESGFVVTREPFGDGFVNLVAAAPGADEGGIWLVAHSDTARRAPGAGDDGLGLGVVTEAARVLGPRGNLHVLITDGEELGLLGARAFVAAHLADRLVINVEARGTSGPGYMFQIAGPVMEAWAEVGCPAQTTSLARTVYELLPNDTDFTVFRGAGAWGYDFALIHGAEHYHMPSDTPEHLDPRSVQQVGDCVTGLARAWLDRPRPVEGSSPLWFQVLGATVVLPTLPVRVLGLVCLLAARPNLRGAAAWIGSLVACALVGLLGQKILAQTAIFYAGLAEMPGAMPVYVAAALVGLGIPPLVLWRGSDATRAGFRSTGMVIAAVGAMVWPEAGYALVPGALASTGPRPLRYLAAGVAGVLLGPILYAIFPALTTRALPILCALPVVLLGWLSGANTESAFRGRVIRR